MILEAIQNLVNGKKLTLIDIREVFDEILSGLADEVSVSSFLTAIKFSDLSDDEIVGAINSSKESIKKPKIAFNNINSIENINLNYPKNIMNLSLIQDLICSANNLPIVRYCFEDNFEKDVNFKIFNILGVDFSKAVDVNSTEYEKLNFSYNILNNENKFVKYSSKYRNNLPFDNLLNLVSNFLNIFDSKNMYLGVNSKEQVDKFANVFLKLKYDNSIILSSQEGYPFVSLFSDTYVAEAWKNKIFTYNLSPNLLGFEKYSIESLVCETIEENVQDLKKILNNQIDSDLNKAKYDFVVLNSGLALYISKISPSIVDGVNLAKKTLETGQALEKFNQINKFYN